MESHKERPRLLNGVLQVRTSQCVVCTNTRSPQHRLPVDEKKILADGIGDAQVASAFTALHFGIAGDCGGPNVALKHSVEAAALNLACQENGRENLHLQKIRVRIQSEFVLSCVPGT